MVEPKMHKRTKLLRAYKSRGSATAAAAKIAANDALDGRRVGDACKIKLTRLCEEILKAKAMELADRREDHLTPVKNAVQATPPRYTVGFLAPTVNTLRPLLAEFTAGNLTFDAVLAAARTRVSDLLMHAGGGRSVLYGVLCQRNAGQGGGTRAIRTRQQGRRGARS